MSMSRITKGTALPALGIILLGCASYFITKVLASAPTQGSQTTVTPFTLKSETYFYGQDPDGTLADVDTVARRSDGTTVRVTSEGPMIAKGIKERTIQYMDGSRVDLLDADKEKTTRPPASQEAVDGWRTLILQPPAGCVFNSTDLLLQAHGGEVLGQVVSEVRPPSPPDYRITSWKAPGLACETLEYKSEKEQPDGSYVLSSWQKPISLHIGEPDPKLFDPGHGYAEMKPSQLARALGALLGYPAPSEVPATTAHADEDYETLWANHPDWQGH